MRPRLKDSSGRNWCCVLSGRLRWRGSGAFLVLVVSAIESWLASGLVLLFVPCRARRFAVVWLYLASCVSIVPVWLAIEKPT